MHISLLHKRTLICTYYIVVNVDIFFSSTFFVSVHDNGSCDSLCVQNQVLYCVMYMYCDNIIIL